MKKETFVKAINSIQDQIELDVRISEKLGEVFPDAFTATLLPQNNIVIEGFMDVLRDEMNDTDDWIGWFCHETNFGKESDLGAYDKDGGPIKMNNAGDLYDLLNEIKKEMS